jgi:hypothetical protein
MTSGRPPSTTLRAVEGAPGPPALLLIRISNSPFAAEAAYHPCVIMMPTLVAMPEGDPVRNFLLCRSGRSDRVAPGS